MRYSKDGKFINRGGRPDTGRENSATLHGIAIDSRGRVFVADRGNNRIQLFDQEGKQPLDLDAVRTPSGIAFDDKDQIYVADSESDGVNKPWLGAGNQDRRCPTAS